jgi:hypothetical protein
MPPDDETLVGGDMLADGDTPIALDESEAGLAAPLEPRGT